MKMWGRLFLSTGSSGQPTWHSRLLPERDQKPEGGEHPKRPDESVVNLPSCVPAAPECSRNGYVTGACLTDMTGPIICTVGPADYVSLLSFKAHGKLSSPRYVIGRSSHPCADYRAMTWSSQLITSRARRHQCNEGRLSHAWYTLRNQQRDLCVLLDSEEEKMSAQICKIATLRE